jgi:predicted nucleotide-binding protein
MDKVRRSQRHKRALQNVLSRASEPAHEDAMASLTGRSAVLNGAPDEGTVFVAHSWLEETNALRLEGFLSGTLSLGVVRLSDRIEGSSTLMEKLERYASEADFALVLMTPDDRVTDHECHRYKQARPNVIFELGWLCAKLGRARVRILLRTGTTLHSDVSGVDYTCFHTNVLERTEDIRRALRAAGVALAA